MLQKEYRLIIPSGSKISEEYTLLPCEQLAAFHTCSDLSGNVHIEERFDENDSFRFMYFDDKQVKWDQLASGVYNEFANNYQVSRVRFVLSANQNKQCAIFLRVTENR
jgi:hypothetical protein